MRKFTIAALAVLAIAGSTAVYAQYHPWIRDHWQHTRLSPEDRAALVDARIAAVHAGLKLSADQEKLWPPVESAVRDFAKLRMDRAQARMKEREDAQNRQGQLDQPDQQGQPKPDDPVARLRRRADNMATSAAALRKLADAADPLYKTLDEGQKRRLDILTHNGRFGGEGGGWRHRWMERDHDRDRDRDRNGSERL